MKTPRNTDITGNTYNYLTVIEKTSQKRSSSYLWKCQCKCGNFILARKCELESGHTKSCGCFHIEQFKKNNADRAKDLLNQRFGRLVVIEKTDQRQDGRVVWKCKCDCGKIIYASSHNLIGDRKTHCGCQYTASKGEEKIIKLLQEYNIPFEREKVFSDLKYNGKYLRFDFYVDNKYLIEYDGRQHFILDSGYGADLENIQKRDQIKNDYAKSHNIPLIRIPYTEFDSFGIEDLILKESEEDRVK